MVTNIPQSPKFMDLQRACEISSKRRTLEFFYFDAGGGHRSAATALQAVIAELYPHWDVKLINLQELMRPIDPVYKLTKISTENVYNNYLKSGLTYGSGTMLRAMQTSIQAFAPAMQKELQKHWQKSQPDLVVSLIPNFNKIMYSALKQVHPKTPYVTVMTDLADSPPHFWMEKQDQFIICGTELAVRQAHTKGYRPERILQTSGMIIKPHFYEPITSDRKAEREKLGLDPDLTTAFIMFGGQGSKTSIEIVDNLNRSGLPIQSLVMCGHNEKLQQELQSREACHAEGFTKAVPHFMRLGDFFIGKPGPGSISEAVQMGLPVVTEKNHRTMLQERYNATWIRQQNLGMVIRNFNKNIVEATSTLLDNGVLQQYRENAQRINNRAVFEIPDMLEKIMAEADANAIQGSSAKPTLSIQSGKKPHLFGRKINQFRR